MALTITEATAVNTLMHWAMGTSQHYFLPPTRQEAAEAAQLLVSHAYKTLGAGLRPEDINPDDLPAYRNRGDRGTT